LGGDRGPCRVRSLRQKNHEEENKGHQWKGQKGKKLGNTSARGMLRKSGRK